MPRLRELAVSTVRGFRSSEGPALAAALSYHGLATMSPLGVLTLTVTTVVLGGRSARDQLEPVLVRLLGPEGGPDMLELLASRTDARAGALAAALALLFVAYNASALFRALRLSIDRMWGITATSRPTRGRHPLLRNAIVFAAVFLPAIVLAVLTVARAAATGVAGLLGLGSPPALTSLILASTGPLVVWGVVAAIFSLLPDGTMPWRSIVVGSAFTSLAWYAGTWALDVYLSRIATTSRYGAAGALVALLVWVSLMSRLLLVGARLTSEHAALSSTGANGRP